MRQNNRTANCWGLRWALPDSPSSRPSPLGRGEVVHRFSARPRCKTSRGLLSIFRQKKTLLSLLVSSITFMVRAEDPKPVSYFHEVVPILKRSCTGCHHPAKLKGELDLTTYATFQKGGKHGPSFKPETPEESRVIEEISGEEPNMPKEGDPLTNEEVALFQRWIKEGAKDDTPPEANSFKLSAAPVYAVLPAISTMAFSPDAAILA